MISIIIGTTPTIKYNFKIISPSDLSRAVLTIKDRTAEKLRRDLTTATVGTNYIEWVLTQEETLSLGTGNNMTMMLNWLTNDGTRGASAEEQVVGVHNHIREVLA